MGLTSIDFEISKNHKKKLLGPEKCNILDSEQSDECTYGFYNNVCYSFQNFFSRHRLGQ